MHVHIICQYSSCQPQRTEQDKKIEKDTHPVACGLPIDMMRSWVAYFLVCEGHQEPRHEGLEHKAR